MREASGRDGRGQEAVDGAVKRSMATLGFFVWVVAFFRKRQREMRGDENEDVELASGLDYLPTFDSSRYRSLGLREKKKWAWKGWLLVRGFGMGGESVIMHYKEGLIDNRIVWKVKGLQGGFFFVA